MCLYEQMFLSKKKTRWTYFFGIFSHLFVSESDQSEKAACSSSHPERQKDKWREFLGDENGMFAVLKNKVLTTELNAKRITFNNVVALKTCVKAHNANSKHYDR